MRSRQSWVIAFAAHFLIIIAVSCSDILDLVEGGHTMLPQVVIRSASTLSQGMRTISPWRLSRSNPVRQTLVAYSHIAGINAPYTFFAPNVPRSLRVVFELHLPGNEVRRELPRVDSDTEGLRLSALIDSAAASPGLWRDVVLQMLASSALEKNPEAIGGRVIVTALKFPKPHDFLKGFEPTYEFVCAYDFVTEDASSSVEHR
jgi:hypothetical protein